jgi:putative nucleotidyltransferase with HDIG domain
MKPCVLFVDDQERVLEGLHRALQAMRGKWEMLFADSGQAALEQMAISPIDVIISDMRMPGMSGAELLAEVERRDPRVIRIILSGQVDQDSAFRLIGTSHQFLSKPCDPDTIANAVERALGLRDLLADDAVQTLVASQHSLPTPPAIYDSLSQELRAPEPSLDNVAKIVSQDPGLTVKILQLASSGYLGAGHSVSSPIEAVRRLGLARVEALVVAHGAVLENEDIPNGNAWLESFWDHSVACAGLAQAIAAEEGLDQKAVENAFVGGLLHDVGTLVFAANQPEKYKYLVDCAVYENTARLEAERKEFGAIHAAVGAYLVGLWGLPDAIVEVIAYHHTPLDRPSRAFDVVSAVHVAEALTQALLGHRPDDLRSVMSYDYLRDLGVEDRLPAWAELFKKLLREGGRP